MSEDVERRGKTEILIRFSRERHLEQKKELDKNDDHEIHIRIVWRSIDSIRGPPYRLNVFERDSSQTKDASIFCRSIGTRSSWLAEVLREGVCKIRVT